ncbi:MAG TPA: nucleoside triphosphate pyrophosphohydrolase [Acidobacteriaceae bacterium]|nr:nucleoside triphosphate pyrophosphohydrolase [Acidobacteriaceae bacterium]
MESKIEPKLAANTGEAFLQAVAIMARLRAPGGCPWDREQTFASIQRHTLEETYEVLDAIDRENWPDLKDELGDLLLQVLFYAEMAQEADYFTLRDVLENLNAKLIRRHPHVFGDLQGVDKADTVLSNWEAIKQTEKAARAQDVKNASLLDEVPRAFPALLEADKIGKKAASVGFDWTSAEEVLHKLEEEIAELRAAITAQDRAQQEEELGDVLFTVVNLSRKLKLAAEFSLRAGNQKFRRRFHRMEEIAARGKPLEACSASELEALWNQAKREETQPPI